MRFTIRWTKKGEPYRKAICTKYGLPMWETVNGLTFCETTREIRNALEAGVNGGYLGIMHETE